MLDLNILEIIRKIKNIIIILKIVFMKVFIVVDIWNIFLFIWLLVIDWLFNSLLLVLYVMKVLIIVNIIIMIDLSIYFGWCFSLLKWLINGIFEFWILFFFNFCVFM